MILISPQCRKSRSTMPQTVSVNNLIFFVKCFLQVLLTNSKNSSLFTFLWSYCSPERIFCELVIAFSDKSLQSSLTYGNPFSKTKLDSQPKNKNYGAEYIHKISMFFFSHFYLETYFVTCGM